jgi:hypothetical protein
MVLSGTPAHLACLLQCFLPNFFPLSPPPPHPPTPSSTPTPSSPSCPLRIELLPTGAPLLGCFPFEHQHSVRTLLESVQDFRVSSRCHQQPVPNFRASPNATSSPCQIFEPVQDATSSPCQISSQSNVVNPMPLPQIFESVQDHCALLRQKQIGELQVAIGSYKLTGWAHPWLSDVVRGRACAQAASASYASYRSGSIYI